jgi:phage terminase large subunit-like protein
MGLQLQVVATTTPKPTQLIRALRASPTTHLTIGETTDNAANLAPAVIAKLQARYGERWLGKFEQRDKWIAGLTAAMMAAAQEA